MKYLLHKLLLRKQIRELNKTKVELRRQTILNQENTINDIDATLEAYEMMKRFNIKRFDNFFNSCLISSIASSDILLFTHHIALSDQKLEKLLSARMLAMVLIEYLKDANDLIGKKLVHEITENNFKEFIIELQNINSELSKIRKQNQFVLTSIRNNIAAHKTKDALKLINLLYQINIQEIMDIANEVLLINNKFTTITTKIIYRILDEAKEKYEISLRLANPAQ